MQSWQEDLMAGFDEPELSAGSAFARIVEAARALGFDYVSYGVRIPMPKGTPEMLVMHNYPDAWMERYAARNYVRLDPSVKHAFGSRAPVLWHELQEEAPEFWDEAGGHGLRHGLALPLVDGAGTECLLSLSRGHERISPSELDERQLQLRWLSNLSYLALVQRMREEISRRVGGNLSERELEVLKWAAAGKTNDEVGDILNVSTDTVKFHLKNALRKLDCVNKTQAVARAAMLGLLA